MTVDDAAQTGGAGAQTAKVIGFGYFGDLHFIPSFVELDAQRLDLLLEAGFALFCFADGFCINKGVFQGGGCLRGDGVGCFKSPAVYSRGCREVTRRKPSKRFCEFIQAQIMKAKKFEDLLMEHPHLFQ